MQAADNHQSGTLTSAAPVRVPLVIGESYLLIVGLEGDTFGNAIVPKLSTGTNDGDEAQGTLTVDTQPTVGDTLTIGGVSYEITEAGDTGSGSGSGKIPLGDNLAETQASIVSIVNFDTIFSGVTIATFAADEAVITAVEAGLAGNAIGTTETFTAGTNVFDAAVLGTTTAGTDDFASVSALPTPGSADSDGSPQSFAAPGMIYFDAGLPELVLEPAGAVTSVRYYLTLVQSVRGLR